MGMGKPHVAVIVVVLLSSVSLVGPVAGADEPTRRLAAGIVESVRQGGLPCDASAGQVVVEIDLSEDRGRLTGASGVHATPTARFAVLAASEVLRPALAFTLPLTDAAREATWDLVFLAGGTADEALETLFNQDLPGPVDPLPDQPPISVVDTLGPIHDTTSQVQSPIQPEDLPDEDPEKAREEAIECANPLLTEPGEMIEVPSCYRTSTGTMHCGDPTVSTDPDQPGEHLVLTQDGYVHYGQRIVEGGEVRLGLWITGTLEIQQEDPPAGLP